MVPEMSCITLLEGRGRCMEGLDDAGQEELVSGMCPKCVCPSLHLLESRIWEKALSYTGYRKV